MYSEHIPPKNNGDTSETHLIQTKICAKATNSNANVPNSIVNTLNSIAKVTNFDASATNSGQIQLQR